MKTIAILSQKGGAGKTTLAIHLAVAAAREGFNTLIVDLDPQASATKWGDRREAELPLVLSSHASRLDAVLKQARNNDGHLAILDTAPNSDSITLQAAWAADFVLIPCRPAILDLEAIASTLELVHATRTPAVVVLNAVAPVGTEAKEAAGGYRRTGRGSLSCASGQPCGLFAFAHWGTGCTGMEPEGKAAQEILSLHKFICECVHMFEAKVPHYA
jgi:chromosome partitioning protein